MSTTSSIIWNHRPICIEWKAQYCLLHIWIGFDSDIDGEVGVTLSFSVFGFLYKKLNQNLKNLSK